MSMNLSKKYSAMPQAVRTSIWFTFCQFLQRGIAFITVPIFTRLLTTEEYGICNIYFTWFDIFLLFTSLRIPYEGLNNGLIRYEEDKDRYTSSVMGLIMVMTGAGAVIYLLFRRWIDPVTGLSSFIMMLIPDDNNLHDYYYYVNFNSNFSFQKILFRLLYKVNKLLQFLLRITDDSQRSRLLFISIGKALDEFYEDMRNIDWPYTWQLRSSD